MSNIVEQALAEEYICDEYALIEYCLDHHILEVRDPMLLCKAAHGGKEKVVELLLERGADASYIDQKGKNAVMYVHTSPHYHDEEKRMRVDKLLQRSGSPSVWLVPCDSNDEGTSSDVTPQMSFEEPSLLSSGLWGLGNQ